MFDEIKLESQKREYEELVPKYREIESIVAALLEAELKKADINVMELPHRIKTWSSLEEKLYRKQDKYTSIGNITDLLGFRVICFFSSQIDEAADVIDRIFEVDVENSCDKRMLMSPNAFGYISLHKICSLRKCGDYPEELTDLKFEIQLKTILQHAWAEIEHDLGYKTALEIPRDVRREFSRVASLLEIADNSFENIKTSLNEYKMEALRRVRSDTAGQMTLDIHTLNVFMKHSPTAMALYDDMAALTQGRIIRTGAESYLPLLSYLKIETLSDLDQLISQEHEHTLRLLEHALTYSDLEEITSNAALFYSCRAKMIWGDYSAPELEYIYNRIMGDRKKADKMVQTIMDLRAKFKPAD